MSLCEFTQKLIGGTKLENCFDQNVHVFEAASSASCQRTIVGILALSILTNLFDKCQKKSCFEDTNILMNLRSIHFSSLCPFFLLHEKVCSFSSAFLYVHIRTNQTVIHWVKVSGKKEKKFFCKRVKPYYEISFSSFTHKISINM